MAQNLKVSVRTVRRRLRSFHRGSAFRGWSTHNQRIERLWGDLWRGLSNVYYDLFSFLEGEGIIDVDNEKHVFSPLCVPPKAEQGPRKFHGPVEQPWVEDRTARKSSANLCPRLPGTAGLDHYYHAMPCLEKDKRDLLKGKELLPGSWTGQRGSQFLQTSSF
ncbi:hypothetical protein GJAV_G00261460 [Gymnothorax javanicus]|nr:hypothetical protein GJAV_G00261460 [Gymnothorax javanicus]